MHCLEKYRSKLVRNANRQLRIILESPDESAVHDFRVGIKRLRALYGFLDRTDEKLSAKKILGPYRAMFKKLGPLRDAHIAIRLIEDLEPAPNSQSRQLISLLRAGIRRDYRSFRNFLGNDRSLSIKLPTIRAIGIPPAAISRQKPAYLEELLAKTLSSEKRITPDGWHRKRILLKQYRYTLEAFDQCPGQSVDERLLRRIAMLEQLLGDWHDRVVTAELLQSLPSSAADPAPLIRQLKSQARVLLGAAKIYLVRLAQSCQDVGRS
ncbi:MAG: CHAD domain-containing protein [Gammaproteobacteria bacterium]|jgi:CHAD domain-containing protein